MTSWMALEGTCELVNAGRGTWGGATTNEHPRKLRRGPLHPAASQRVQLMAMASVQGNKAHRVCWLVWLDRDLLLA
jgi:hypothetical protein